MDGTNKMDILFGFTDNPIKEVAAKNTPEYYTLKLTMTL